MTIHIIGGVYNEYCAWPEHDTLQGSAGRAALCLTQLDSSLSIKLHARIAPKDKYRLEELFIFNKNFQLEVTDCTDTTKFDYFHPLSEPKITPHTPEENTIKFNITESNINIAVVFGMIEAQPVINCNIAIYDPQNTYDPALFSETGSDAKTLVYITNSNELSIFYEKYCHSQDTVEVMADWLFSTEKAACVVVKCGQKGVYVCSDNDKSWVPAFRSNKIFPIGSGDAFVAAFTYYWHIKGMSFVAAAERSSIAVSYYVTHKMMNNEAGLDIYRHNTNPLKTETTRKMIYLAGPFFTLSELWMVNEAKQYIESFGMDVFSPYHALGIGSAEEVVQKDISAIKECDAMYALFDGCDPGTLFEIGYARSINKPVIILAENPKSEELKMYDGSHCRIFNDFSTSIYHLSWLNL